MQKYQILSVILLSALLLVITSSIAHAQHSEYISSPKQQLDSGVAPYDVVCRNGFVLVDRGTGKIACIKETSIQNTNWNLIKKPYSKLINSEINTTSVQNILAKNIVPDKTRLSQSPYFPILNQGFLSTTFPNSVLVNETFVLEYTWMRNMSDVTAIYFESCDGVKLNTFCAETANTSNIGFVISPDLEFVDVTQTPRAAVCFTYVTESINSESINDEGRTGNFSLKFKEIPTYHDKFSMLLFFMDGSFTLFNATSNGNDTITINETNPIAFTFKNLCDTAHTSNINNDTNIPSQNAVRAQKSIADLRPSCINESLWNLLSHDEMNLIVNNQTTCQLVDGEYVTNLPPLGYRIIPSTQFPYMAESMDAINHTDPRSFAYDIIPDDGWVDGFVNYYNNISKQSYDFFQIN